MPAWTHRTVNLAGARLAHGQRLSGQQDYCHTDLGKGVKALALRCLSVLASAWSTRKQPLACGTALPGGPAAGD